jgi:signal transduction histidine kinase/ActR/RegA family two-component response regulator
VATLPRRHFPLRTHLLLLVVGTLLPVLLLTAFLVRRLVDANHATIDRRLLEASRATAGLVDAELSGTIRALQALALSPRLDDADLRGFYAAAKELQTTQPTWMAVVLRDHDGLQAVNTSRPWDAPPVDVRDLSGIREIFEGRQPLVGTLRLNEGFGAEPVVPVRVPVIRQGRVIYSLTAMLTPTRLADVIRQSRSSPDEWVRSILDTNDVLVTRTRNPEDWIGRTGTPYFLQRIEHAEEGVFQDVSFEGRRVYGAFTRAPRSRWVAGVAVPVSVVESDFKRSMTLLGLLAVLVLALGGGAAYVIARRIARDITVATNAADALATGQEPMLPPTSVAEMQRLADAIVRASDLLKERERERDARVSRADAARAEAEAADRAKDEFMAMLGHELRNPLAPALTALHLVRQQAGSYAAQECEIVERQVRHLARLVDDLLDVSRVRRGSIDLRRERVAVSAVIARAVEMAGPLVEARAHALTIDVPTDLRVDGDPQRLAQVFTNIIGNAAKYTEPGGRIVVSARRDEGWIVIDCRDNGIGIRADLLSRVFDLFVQGDRALDRRQGGLGLGLGVARTLVERHGGTIEAHSDGPGRGSTFVVRLPAPADDDEPFVRADETPWAGIPASTRVLVVEDNSDALEMLVRSLRGVGLFVEGAADALAALERTSAVVPHVAVLDIGLPRIDGYQLARQLRSAVPSIRLIALTGYGRDADEAAAKDAGFDIFLVKPVSVDVLLECIGELMGKKDGPAASAKATVDK